MTDQPPVYTFWAKTDPEGNPALTVRDHCLIVGSVAIGVLKRLPTSTRNIAPFGSSTLIACHDIGKISPGFQKKCTKSEFNNLAGAQFCESNHAIISQTYLASLPNLQNTKGVPSLWVLSAGGHHGVYFAAAGQTPKDPIRGDSPFTWPQKERDRLLAELKTIFGELPTIGDNVERGARLHWMTGLTTFCDWIGSNTQWFSLSQEPELKDQYTPEETMIKVEAALEEIGWHRRSVRPALSFQNLFGEGFSPRVLQQELINLGDRPGLYIVEAPMGMGKTEAALALAYRRWCEGGEAGLYFALPTQLTSNRIHDRVTTFLEKVIDDTTVQILAHSNAWLREDRVRSFSPADSDPTKNDTGEACKWFASDRKPLLTPFGTGTIDQAIMACMSAKHSAVRLFALSGKVVVIDEVHSYDPYTSALVDQTIRWLREVGCTVIVLSATLTAKRRQEMIERVGGCEPAPPTNYPLITKVVDGEVSHHPIEDIEIKESQVYLCSRDQTDENIIQDIVKAAESGACVLVIRNTVKWAQETYQAIKSEAKEGLQIGLLHSRFPYFQRQENELRWMTALGKTGESRPKGCVLIATQVVEQSVDIDADLLVTDLAPSDLILQRMGRLHRHPRQRPVGFDAPSCWILYPTVNWEENPQEIKKSIGAPAYIYPPVSFYFSKKIWGSKKHVTIPKEIREVLEEEESLRTSSEHPHGAQALLEELNEKTENMIAKAQNQGVWRNDALSDEDGIQTRYNPSPTALLILLACPPKENGGQIEITPLHGEPTKIYPGRFNYDLAKSLHENAVRIPRYLVRGVLASQPSWLENHIDNAVLAIKSPESEILSIEYNDSYQILYSEEKGIYYRKLDQHTQKQEIIEEDAWY